MKIGEVGPGTFLKSCLQQRTNQINLRLESMITLVVILLKAFNSHLRWKENPYVVKYVRWTTHRPAVSVYKRRSIHVGNLSNLKYVINSLHESKVSTYKRWYLLERNLILAINVRNRLQLLKFYSFMLKRNHTCVEFVRNPLHTAVYIYICWLILVRNLSCVNM